MQIWFWQAALGVLALIQIVTIICFIYCVRKAKRTAAPENTADAGREAKGSFEQQFFSMELLEILGIDRTSDGIAALMAQPKKLEAAVYNGNIAEFPGLVRGKSTDEIYRLINRSLSNMIPPVYERGGIVETIRDAGAVALFPENCEQSLNAAIAVCDKMHRDKESGCFRNFTSGLCYGSVQVGVVGHDRRLSVHVLSEYTGLSGYLQSVGVKYYARILAVGGFVDKIHGFQKKYNHRLLGCFYLEETGRMEKVYDVFDGDDADTRNRKRKTKLVFEKGVNLFLERRSAEARGYFIEVLKADKNDSAAREYVYICDRYRALPEDEQRSAPVYIELL